MEGFKQEPPIFGNGPLFVTRQGEIFQGGTADDPSDTIKWFDDCQLSSCDDKCKKESNCPLWNNMKIDMSGSKGPQNRKNP